MWAALLPALDRDPLLERVSLTSGVELDCGRLTVGTRLVDMMKVGSEMSFFLTTFLSDSFRVLVVVLNPGVDGADGRLGDGTGAVGVVTLEPLVLYGE